MNNTFKRNCPATTLLKIQVIYSLPVEIVAITHFAIRKDTQLTHHAVAMEKVAEQYILTKYS